MKSIRCLALALAACALCALCACNTLSRWRYDASTHTLYVNSDSVMVAYEPDAEEADGTTTNAPWAAYLPEIESIVIGDRVTRIGDYAFAFCPALKTVTVGENVAALGWRCFYRCGDWENKAALSVTFKGAVVPAFGVDTFGYTWDNKNMTVNVPAALYDGYMSQIGNTAIRIVTY